MSMRLTGAVACVCLLLCGSAFAQDTAPPGGGRNAPFPFQGGQAIFTGVCQGCHMPDAKGATGAGTYPALAHNPKLEVAGYPVSVIVHGQKAMPPLGKMLSDQQVADVTNYIRTHFGNSYKDMVKPEAVKAVR
jgi:mono/diheme cytochrome c family protein